MKRSIRFSNKLVAFMLVMCMLLLSFSGCGKTKGNSSDAQSGNVTENENTKYEASEHNDTEDAVPQDIKLPVSERDCKLSGYALPGNTGIYKIDCTEILDGIEWIYLLSQYNDKIMLLYEDSDIKLKLALIDPYSLEVTGPVSIESGISFYSGLFADSQGRIVAYYRDTNKVAYYNEKLQVVEEYKFSDVISDNVYFSGDGEYAYYLNSNEGIVYKYNIRNNKKEQLFKLDESYLNYYCVLDGVLNDRYVVFSYFPYDETSTQQIIDITDNQVVYSDDINMSCLGGNENNFSLKYSMDGLDEIVCGRMGNDANILVLSNLEEYGNYKIFHNTDSLISYVANNSDNNPNSSITFRGYDMATGRMCHSKTVDFPEENYVYGVNDVCYDSNLDYMTFITTFITDHTTPVIYIWDLLEPDSKIADNVSYLRPYPATDDSQATGLTELKSRAEGLSRRFGVDIIIAEGIEECPVLDYEYTPIYNPIRIEQTLNIIERELTKYPEGMLSQLEDDIGSRLHIYLSGKITGIMDGTISNSRGIANTIDGIKLIVVDITDINNLDRTLHHEIFHSIEDHMSLTGYGFDHDNWISLNPSGFNYDFDYVLNEQNEDWDYVVNTDTEGYFMDIYSKSFPHEDRARIMEYAMTESKYNSGAFAYDGITKKHDYICRQIRLAFDTTGWPETTIWEQVLR